MARRPAQAAAHRPTWPAAQGKVADSGFGIFGSEAAHGAHRLPLLLSPLLSSPSARRRDLAAADGDDGEAPFSDGGRDGLDWV